MQTKGWDRPAIIDFLSANDGYDDFVNGKNAGILYSLEGVDFLLYRILGTVELFFPAPYMPEIQYESVIQFFKICRPVLSEILNDASDSRLMSN